GVPVKEEIDFGGAAAGDGAHGPQTGNAVYSFFDRLGDGDEHLVDGRDAVVDADHNAREIGAWENGNGNRKGQVGASGGKSNREEENGTREPLEPRRDSTSFGRGRRTAHADYSLSFSGAGAAFFPAAAPGLSSDSALSPLSLASGFSISIAVPSGTA